MAMQQWPKFSNKEASCRNKAQEDMVGFHQPVLKSTTSAGLVALVYLVCFVCLVEQDKPDGPDKPQPATTSRSELPLGLRLEYSDKEMRSEGV
jgi:hypothetical protein